MSAIAANAAEYNISVWSYKGKLVENSRTNFRRVNHRRLGHLPALISEGYQARISDSTHFHLEYPNPILLPCWIAAKFFLKFKWIKILHDGSLPSRYEKFNRGQRLLFKRAIRHIDEIVVYSRELETWLREVIGFDKKIYYIPLFFPLPSDWGSGVLTDDFNEKLGRFARFQKRVCSIGVFIPSYGFQTIANAVEKLRRETKVDIGLFLVDGGFARDEKFRAEVLKGRDWIITAESVPHPNLPHIFRQSEVFVRGFEHESYGLSRVEAIMCGTPVIATNEGETRGMLIYEYNNEAALISHLKNVLNENFLNEANIWAEIFQKEAKQNLENNLRLISGMSS